MLHARHGVNKQSVYNHVRPALLACAGELRVRVDRFTSRTLCRQVSLHPQESLSRIHVLRREDHPPLVEGLHSHVRQSLHPDTCSGAELALLPRI